MLYTLFTLDLLWSALAWTVDFQKLYIVPPWAWIFCFICPIYPLLLSFIWYKKAQNRNVHDLLWSLAVLPSCVFGILALVYYPLKMVNQGFNFTDLGQILWVMFYSTQAWYLFFIHRKTQKTRVIFVLFFLLLEFYVEFKYLTFGYLNFDGFTHPQTAALFIIALFCSLVLCLYRLVKTTS